MEAQIFRLGMEEAFERWKQAYRHGIVINQRSKMVHEAGCLNLIPFKDPSKSMTRAPKICLPEPSLARRDFTRLVAEGKIEIKRHELKWTCGNCNPPEF